jgi:hypothetical protein
MGDFTGKMKNCEESLLTQQEEVNIHWSYPVEIHSLPSTTVGRATATSSEGK